MKPNLAEDVARRRLLCQEVAARLGLQPASVEKDYWLCWTLRNLIATSELGPEITFKGGTSLSKGFRLIERFSEDLDLVVGRGHLGFGGDRSPDLAGISGKERERRLNDLRAAARAWVASKALPILDTAIRAAIGTGSFDLGIDPEDADGQTILFRYPTAFDGERYVRAVVKLEFGARSDTEPVLEPEIRSYLSETMREALDDDSFRIRTIAPKRTFWEKAMLLHEEAHRAAGAELKGRLSRHLYDLSCLIRAGVGREAEEDMALFDAVAAHRRVFFARNRPAHDSLRRGTLRMLPAADRTDIWAKDYAAMRGTMFFGTPPAFEEILRDVEEFERAFNADRSR
jgi:hypothetical protein